MGRKFGRSEVEAKSVWARLEVDKRFEMRIVHRPLYRGEIVAVVPNGDLAVNGLLWVCALAVDEEDLLMDLPMMLASSSYSIVQEHDTQELSETERTRGASGDVAGMGIGRSPFWTGMPCE